MELIKAEVLYYYDEYWMRYTYQFEVNGVTYLAPIDCIIDILCDDEDTLNKAWHSFYESVQEFIELRK